MRSVISFPDRGPWGSSKWKGNCSGHVQRELIEAFKPTLFLDICEGSATSRQVARDMGVEYVGFDLHDGVDFTSTYLLSMMPRPADLSFAHPPYADIIDYSKVGSFADPSLIDRDLSRCSIEEFLEKSRVMLLNERECTRSGGHYSALLGDVWRNGKFYSFQADYLKFMPRDEHVGLVIKAQHNVASGRKEYTGTKYPMLCHEYLLIWRRGDRTLVQLTVDQLRDLKKQTSSTWRALVRMALMKSDGRATLQEIYGLVEQAAGEKLRANKNWQAKVRQVLQNHFEQVRRGEWAIQV